MAVAQSLQISLSGTIYTFRLYWNSVLNCWVADIGDGSNNPIVQGVPLVPGVFLLEQYAYLDFPGDLFTQQSSDVTAIPDYASLGVSAGLYYAAGLGAGSRNVSQSSSNANMTYTTDQWLRKWELVLYNPLTSGPGAGQALVLSQGSDAPGQESLRMRFDITNTMIPTPNAAVIRIHNPSPATVSTAVKEFIRVTVTAGYVNGRYGTIFDGWITQFKFGGDTPVDKYLEITAQDGDLAINQATINRVLMPGFNHPQSVTEALVQAMGPKGVNPQFDATGLGVAPNTRPVVLWGAVAEHMYVTSKTTDTVWSLQQGKLVVVPAPGANVANLNIKANALTGLIGFPTSTNDGIELKTLMNPFAKIGGFITINNADINQVVAGVGGANTTFQQVRNESGGLNFYASVSDDNTYMIANVGFTGDTRGQDWYTNMIAITVDPHTGQLTAAQELVPTPQQVAAQTGTAPPDDEPPLNPPT